MNICYVSPNSRITLLLGFLTVFAAGHLRGASVQLQNATATLSQNGGWLVGTAIDGVINDVAGWAGYNFSANQAGPETAVFETSTDAGFSGGSLLTFQLFQVNHNLEHTIGRFRLSVTTDDRNSFANGLANGGDVTANWFVLSPLTTLATGGILLTPQSDDSIFAGGLSPTTSIYTVTAATGLEHITGFRLELLEDSRLPFDGPGRYPGNGNFVLTEFQVGIVAVPEPSVVALFACAGIVLVAMKAWRTNRNPRIPF